MNGRLWDNSLNFQAWLYAVLCTGSLIHFELWERKRNFHNYTGQIKCIEWKWKRKKKFLFKTKTKALYTMNFILHNSSIRFNSTLQKNILKIYEYYSLCLRRRISCRTFLQHIYDTINVQKFSYVKHTRVIE